MFLTHYTYPGKRKRISETERRPSPALETKGKAQKPKQNPTETEARALTGCTSLSPAFRRGCKVNERTVVRHNHGSHNRMHLPQRRLAFPARNHVEGPRPNPCLYPPSALAFVYPCLRFVLFVILMVPLKVLFLGVWRGGVWRFEDSLSLSLTFSSIPTILAALSFSFSSISPCLSISLPPLRCIYLSLSLPSSLPFRNPLFSVLYYIVRSSSLSYKYTY